MENACKTDVMRGGGRMCASPILQGGDTGSSDVQVGGMGDVRRNYESGWGHLCGVPTSYHGEVGKAVEIQGMGDTVGWGSTTGRVNAVVGHVNRPPAGDSVAGVTPMTTSEVLRIGYWTQEESQEEKIVVKKKITLQVVTMKKIFQIAWKLNFLDLT